MFLVATCLGKGETMIWNNLDSQASAAKNLQNTSIAPYFSERTEKQVTLGYCSFWSVPFL